MSLNTGLLIYNRYRIVRLLGQGGFGAVYRAWDVSLNKPVALKRNLDTTIQAQQQFEREAKTLGNLAHPNLPRVTDHFFIPSLGQFLVMDYIEGEDLEKIIQRTGKIEPARALGWIEQVASALTYLHNQPSPIIHRDIKPANIRITDDGKAYLVDFGLVKLYSKGKKTTIGARAVTPGFSPPEQYGQGNTDGRTDVYALAATLYVALTGQEPVESIQRIVLDEQKLASDVNPIVSLKVSEAIAKAMMLSPTQRFESADEFQIALKSTRDQPPPQPKTILLSSTTVSDFPSTSIRSSNKRVHPLFWTLGAGVLVTFVFLAIVLPNNRRQTEAALAAQAELLINIEATDQAIERATRQVVSQLTSTNVAMQTGTAQVKLTTTRQAQLILTDDEVSANLTATSRAAATATTLAQATDTIRAQLAATQEIRITRTRQALSIAGTQQAQLTATRSARSTATRQARIERTQQAQEVATQQAQATLDAADAYVTSIAPPPSSLITTINGELTHEVDGSVEIYNVRYGNSLLERKNFILEVNFINPYDASFSGWDYGVFFRSRGMQYRLFITSNRTWHFYYVDYSGEDPIFIEIETGELPRTTLVEKGEENKFYLAAQGDQGVFYINDGYVTTLDLSRIDSSGLIRFGTGFFGGNEIAGEKTEFRDMKVWILNE